jgi:hypothetical protein
VREVSGGALVVGLVDGDVEAGVADGVIEHAQAERDQLTPGR